MRAGTSMTDDRRAMPVPMPLWRALVSATLVALACAYLVPIERSIGMFTDTTANASVVSSGNLQPPVTLPANATVPGTIQLNWPASPSAFATGYAIYRIADGEPDYSLITTQVGHGTSSYIDGGLAPTTLYTYRVEAICGDWTSAPSPVAFAITNP